eukprot:GHVH01001283.1.p1 GENE.GHVH01001283.1~~GHVH01001283.1.p1  ORF type:complete len:210 (-),score=24.96 GHVH01001283.1:1054-1683(-)
MPVNVAERVPSFEEGSVREFELTAQMEVSQDHQFQFIPPVGEVDESVMVGTVNSEVLGFIGYLASYVVMILWVVILVWPEHLLWSAGFTFLPSRYWCIATPLYVVFVPIMIVLIWVVRSTYLIPDYDSLCWITDEFSVPEAHIFNEHSQVPWQYDQPIVEANNHLYEFASRPDVGTPSRSSGKLTQFVCMSPRDIHHPLNNDVAKKQLA